MGVGCSIEKDPERNSEDSARTSAMEMPMDRVIVDNVDYWNGDRTDWKYFTVTEAGIVTVIVNFDNEEAKPDVEVASAVGQILSDLDLPESTTFLRMLSFKAAPGNYYLHLTADEGGTDYSLEVKFKSMN